MEVNKIIQGDSLSVLKTLPSESVNCVVTSPPYWGLRDYGIEGQLGLEKTFEEYITKLCDIFDEIKRVLRKDGTCWVNLGDTYAGGGGWTGIPDDWESLSNNSKQPRFDHKKKRLSVQDKSLCLIPQRFVIEMVNRGWILRNTIIWHKPNCMPSSAKDRFTVDFEYVFFFVKNKSYWFEQVFEDIQESTKNDKRTINGYKNIRGRSWDKDPNSLYGAMGSMKVNPLGRNKRCVWTITTKPFKEAHFATYPEKLIEPMIQAGCPRYVCKKCGKAREKIIISNRDTTEEYKIVDKINNKSKSRYDGSGKILSNDQTTGMQHRDIGPNGERGMYKKTEWTGGYSSCSCNAGFEGGIVLDPFSGAGTTAVVAKKQGKRYLGIELKSEYIEMSNNRIDKIPELLF
jgi:site-specific DNA-methyltransferase (adenine-specific)